MPRDPRLENDGEPYAEPTGSRQSLPTQGFESLPRRRILDFILATATFILSLVAVSFYLWLQQPHCWGWEPEAIQDLCQAYANHTVSR